MNAWFALLVYAGLLTFAGAASARPVPELPAVEVKNVVTHVRLNPFAAGSGVAGVEVSTRYPRLAPVTPPTP